MVTTVGNGRFILRHLTLDGARFSLRHFTGIARFNLRHFIGPTMTPPTLFARGVCFVRPIKQCFAMPFKTAFCMYAKARVHTIGTTYFRSMLPSL